MSYCDGCDQGGDCARDFRLEIPNGITDAVLVEHLRALMPIVVEETVDLLNCYDRPVLGVVDALKGFCKPGCGPLAPPAPDAVIDKTIEQIIWLANSFRLRELSIIVWRDCHSKLRLEPPFPLHCEDGTEEAELVERLTWLELFAGLIVNKQCIDGWVGAERLEDGSLLKSEVFEFLLKNRTDAVVVSGFCTDLCDMQLVLPLLSARNSGLLPDLKDVIVFVPGCATYDLPLKAARGSGLSDTAAHPREALHHIGLYLMQHSGARLVRSIKV